MHLLSFWILSIGYSKIDCSLKAFEFKCITFKSTTVDRCALSGIIVLILIDFDFDFDSKSLDFKISPIVNVSKLKLFKSITKPEFGFICIIFND